MSETHPRLERQSQLYNLADNQAGYFTAHQALELGYAYQYQQHHRQTGAWLEVGRGLFRLRDYPSSDTEELVRLSLWSHNRAGIAQAVVSHATALEVYELSDFMPNCKSLTVPPGFRKSPPPGVELHRAILEPSEVETRVGYRITTPLRTLLDLAQTPFNLEHLESAVGQALERGLVRQGKLLEAIASFKDTFKDAKARDRLLNALEG